MKKEMGLFALGALVAIVLLGGTNALNLRADGVQFTDGSVQISAAVDTTCDGEPCDGTYFANVVASAGDNASAFFSTGQVEEPRIDDAITRDAELVAALTPRRFEFLGTTTAIPADSGVLSMTKRCQSEFGAGARMCSSEEVVETINVPPPSSWQTSTAWIRPTYQGTDTVNGQTDISGMKGQSHNFTCSGWSWPLAPGSGLVIKTPEANKEAQFGMEACDTAAGVACCAPASS